MTEQQYETRRAAIMARIFRHSKTLSNGTLVFPRSLKKDKAELKKLDTEWDNQNKK